MLPFDGLIGQDGGGMTHFPRRVADKAVGESMIQLTRLDHTPFVLNADLIEHLDATPDTVITLITGQILRVRESTEEVVGRVVAFRRLIHGAPAVVAALHTAGPARPERIT
jgi:flagellar protein FlbD